MSNNENPSALKTEGKYQSTKTFKSTGEEVVGYGDTRQEAKEQLKAKLKEYLIPYPPGAYRQGMPRYQPMLVPTGEYVDSPGFTEVQLANGKSGYRYMSERKAQVRARPNLATTLGFSPKNSDTNIENNITEG